MRLVLAPVFVLNGSHAKSDVRYAKSDIACLTRDREQFGVISSMRVVWNLARVPLWRRRCRRSRALLGRGTGVSLTPCAGTLRSCCSQCCGLVFLVVPTSWLILFRVFVRSSRVSLLEAGKKAKKKGGKEPKKIESEFYAVVRGPGRELEKVLRVVTLQWCGHWEINGYLCDRVCCPARFPCFTRLPGPNLLHAERRQPEGPVGCVRKRDQRGRARPK